jgi:predicted ATPase
MIKEIHLCNWKSFRDATLFFDPLTVLIGTNASGKSNALDAIDFLARIAQSKDLTSCLQADGNGDAFRGGVDWVALRGHDTFSLSVVAAGEDEYTDYRYEITVNPVPRPVVTQEKLTRIKRRPRSKQTHDLNLFWTEDCALEAPAITARLYNTKNGTPRPMQRSLPALTQLQIAGSAITNPEITAGVQAIWKALSRLFILNPIPSHMRAFSSKSEKLAHDGSNLAGVIAALPEQSKSSVESTILRYVKDLPEKDILSLKAELYGPFQSDAMLVCEEGWQADSAPLKVDSRAMSDGTLRFIAIVTALLTLPERTQLVIEEVDNGLHPSRSDLLLRMLKEIGTSRHIDVLASTHNPALLDALGPEMVPFVVVAHRDPQQGDSHLTLLEDIVNLPKILASGRLGAITTSGALERQLEMDLS